MQIYIHCIFALDLRADGDDPLKRSFGCAETAVEIKPATCSFCCREDESVGQRFVEQARVWTCHRGNRSQRLVPWDDRYLVRY